MINLNNDEAITIEALIRWPQPDGSMITPDQFIPLAESSGLINELGTWVIKKACQDCAQLRQQGFANLRVAVNISVVQFNDKLLQKTVENSLKDANLPATALELELTESLFLDETEQIQIQLQALSQLGVTIAIDDFGTGYSNLGYLRKFNASTLKIDRSFISKISDLEHEQHIVNAIIMMSKSLGIQNVAEGIEDFATMELLRDLGCDYGQGFYFTQALASKEFEAWLSTRREAVSATFEIC